MYLKLCDDTLVIRAVQASIARIRNPEKRRYAEDFWGAMYREAAGQGTDYPDTATYKLGAMALQAVRNHISDVIERVRSKY